MDPQSLPSPFLEGSLQERSVGEKTADVPGFLEHDRLLLQARPGLSHMPRVRWAPSPGMSEYQYYEFAAIDRSLSKEEMAELRAISTRAEITPTRFMNTYEWGDLKADPLNLVKKYFDAFVYLANWGTRECMFRLPREKVDLKALEPYCKGDDLTVRRTSSCVVFSFGTDGQESEVERLETGEEMMASLLPIRDLLLSGDLRPLYLSWLQRVQREEVEPHVVEPPVPPGLGSLSAALTALVELLELDAELVEVAVEGAGEVEEVDVQRWLQRLPPAEKDAWLARVIRDAGARADLLRKYRKAGERSDAGRRTAGELLTEARRRREERQKAWLERRQREQERERARDAARREEHLKRLAADEAGAWAQVDELIAQKPARYAETVALLRDLEEACRRVGREQDFQRRLRSLREDHARKSSFIRRLDEARLGAP
jgi:hypothetical protein